MKTALWSIVRDENFYIDMMIDSSINFVDEIFIVDTGSNDGTWEKLKKYEGDKVHILKKDFGGLNRFGIIEGQEPGLSSSPFREADARNFAMEFAKSSNPDWLVQCDADEVYNKRHWEIFDEVKNFSSTLGCSGNVPLTFNLISANPHPMVYWGPYYLYDPHVRAWRTDLNVSWVYPDNTKRCIPRIKGTNKDLGFDYVITDNVRFHLHRSFGPKSIYVYLTKFHKQWWETDVPVLNIFDQSYYEKHFPEWFENGKFVPKADLIRYRIETWGAKVSSHPLPDCVIEKWKNWGKWPDEYCGSFGG